MVLDLIDLYDRDFKLLLGDTTFFNSNLPLNQSQKCFDSKRQGILLKVSYRHSLAPLK